MITGADKSYCRKCGRCCWNWKENKPEERCTYLTMDLRYCMVHKRRAEVGMPQCIGFPTIEQACDLPEDCGYVQAWKAAGLI